MSWGIRFKDADGPEGSSIVHVPMAMIASVRIYPASPAVVTLLSGEKIRTQFGDKVLAELGKYYAEREPAVVSGDYGVSGPRPMSLFEAIFGKP